MRHIHSETRRQPSTLLLKEWRDRQMAASPHTIENLYGSTALLKLLLMQVECDAYPQPIN